MSQIREISKERGRLEARRHLRRVAKIFTTNRIDPNDFETIFDPVQYVVFSGHSGAGCSRIQFLDRPPNQARKERILDSLSKAIDRGDVGWRTYRIREIGEINVRSVITDGPTVNLATERRAKRNLAVGVANRRTIGSVRLSN